MRASSVYALIIYESSRQKVAITRDKQTALPPAQGRSAAFRRSYQLNLAFDAHLNARARYPHALAAALPGGPLVAQADAEGALLLRVELEHIEDAGRAGEDRLALFVQHTYNDLQMQRPTRAVPNLALNIWQAKCILPN